MGKGDGDDDGDGEGEGESVEVVDGGRTGLGLGGRGEVGVYPMDFYAKEGLGRTREEDVPGFEKALEMEIEVR